MTPSELSWTQGFFFFFLGTLPPGIWICARKCRSKLGTREDEVQGVQMDIEMGTNLVQDEPPSELNPLLLRGGDDEGRAPSNHASEDIVFTALPCSYDRKRCSPGYRGLRSNRRKLKPPSMKKSRRVDVVPKAESRMLRWKELASNMSDPVTPWVPPATAGLPRPPRRHFVLRPLPLDEEIPEVICVQAETFQGLRYRVRTRPLDEEIRPLDEKLYLHGQGIFRALTVQEQRVRGFLDRVDAATLR